jgi:hypothetical protein
MISLKRNNTRYFILSLRKGNVHPNAVAAVGVNNYLQWEILVSVMSLFKEASQT